MSQATISYLSSKIDVNVGQCERAIGHIFFDKLLCAEALNAAADFRASYCNGKTEVKLAKNDRLSIYGESVASQTLCRQWYELGDKKGMSLFPTFFLELTNSFHSCLDNHSRRIHFQQSFGCKRIRMPS